MTEDGARETWLGWTRLGCTLAFVPTVPVWALLTGSLHQLHPGLRDLPLPIGLGLSGLLCAIAVVLASILVVGALILSGWAVRRWRGWRRERQVERYQSIVGDGGVLRADSWPDTESETGS